MVAYHELEYHGQELGLLTLVDLEEHGAEEQLGRDTREVAADETHDPRRHIDLQPQYILCMWAFE